MLNDSITKDENHEVAICAQFLKASLQIPPTLAEVENLVNHKKPSFDKKRAPDVELKHFPSSLRYEFLGPYSTYPVIINASLSASQINSLLRVLRMHRKAIGYTLDDINGIHPFVCMHHILMEDDHKLSIKHQRRLNPNM